MNSIPESVFPVSLDSDRTLFKVYNSSQSVLAKALTADATEIEIRPVAPNDPDIWAENGFVSLSDEIVYYDAVEKNQTGKVMKFLRCLRGYEGTPSSNPKGTPVYGNVIAEHHNQLAAAIVSIENTIGDLVDAMTLSEPAKKSMAHLTSNFSMATTLTNIVNCAAPADDCCPEVQFILNVISTGPGGTTVEYCVLIYGYYTSYRLDFGDGQYTTTQFTGTHTYASSSNINPYVTVTGNTCTITQQPISYANGMPFPTVPSVNPLVVTIPEVPNFPTFVAPVTACPGNLFNLPPLIIPTVDCSGGGGGSSSSISVDWGIAPVISCIVTVGCPSISEMDMTMAMANPMAERVGAYDVPLDADDLGIPSEINLIHNLPSQIQLIAESVPASIKIDAVEVPRSIMLVPSPDFPRTIQLDANIQVTGIPKSIEIVHDIPKTIKLEMPDDPYIPMRWDGKPVDVNIHIDIAKALSEIIIAQPGK